MSLLCSAVPLAAQDDVECLVGSTSLLDVEGVMLKIQTGSEKNKIFPRNSTSNSQIVDLIINSLPSAYQVETVDIKCMI